MTGIRRTYNYMRERERLTNNMHTLFPLFVAIILSSTCFEQTSSWFQTFAVFWMLYAFFRVIPRRLNFICRRFGTLCLFHLHRRTGVKDTYPPMKMGQSVPKRRHIKFRRRGITHKKAYNDNLVSVLVQNSSSNFCFVWCSFVQNTEDDRQSIGFCDYFKLPGFAFISSHHEH